MPLTLKDIAEMVGVAESTVSRAINNKSGVGKETRKKILKIVEKYNYSPNKFARGLAKNRSDMIALLIPELSTLSNVSIIKSVENLANSKGYQIILCNTGYDLEKEKTYLNFLNENWVDGAIIVGGKRTDEYIIKTALDEKNHIVLINRLTEEILIPTVLVDNSYGAYLAVEHLINRDVRKISIIMGKQVEYLESEKLEGYRKALTDNGIEYDENYVISTDGSREDGYEAFLELMKLPDPPRGFFVTGDISAAGVVEAIKMGGYYLPGDFKVVGYGESLITSIINPSLTVVAEPLKKIGELATQNLISLINGQSPGQMIKVLEPVLKKGDST